MDVKNVQTEIKKIVKDAKTRGNVCKRLTKSVAKICDQSNYCLCTV